MKEEEKRSLIAHIIEESQAGPPITPSDDFENALFAERIRDYLIDQFGDQDPAKYI